MITDLVKVGKNWLDRDYPLRQQALQFAAPEFCLSEPSFHLALDWIFSFWNEETLRKCQSEKTYHKVVQVVAGNTPAVIAQAFLQGAMMNAPQIMKVPTFQSSFPMLLHASFKDTSLELANLFYVDTWRDNLPALYHHIANADLVIAYGSDETTKLIQSYCSSSTLFRAEGHAVSAAVIFKEAANRDSLQKLAWDMLSYDQRGCLSPRVTFVESGGELSPDQCATVFANEILPLMAKQFPRGGLLPGEAEAILQKRALYGFRGMVYQGDDWTVCYDDKCSWPEESLPRFMPFKSFSNHQELYSVLSSVRDHLISVGVAGEASDFFQQFNIRHVSGLGSMQKQLLFTYGS